MNETHSIHYLREKLQTGSRKDKIDSIRLLGEAHDVHSFELIAMHLHHEDVLVQRAALYALPKLDPQRASGLAIPFLLSPIEQVRRTASAVLTYAAPNELVVGTITGLLSSDEASVVFALDVIRMYGMHKHTEKVQPFLDHCSYKVRGSAVAAVITLSRCNIVLDSIIPRLQDINAVVRQITCGYLGNYGTKVHIPYLENKYTDNDEEVRQVAAQAVFLIQSREGE